MAQTKDYYAVLGVSASATQDDIKKQYRRLAKQHHPDANPNDSKAADKFKEISEAYNVIGDAEKRKQYDDMRRLGAFGGYGSARSGASRGAYRRPGQTSGGSYDSTSGSTFNFEEFDVGGLGGLGDLFGSMFGGGRAGTRARGAERGQSVETTLEIPFRIAVLGGKVPVELEVNEECATCHGSGAAPGATIRQCSECNGRGTISFGQGGFAVTRPCPNCLGRGQVPNERCATCKGVGEVRTRRKVMISVPSGVDSGSKIRLKGQGGKGTNGGDAGDLVITFQVKPDHFYKREGNDLIATIPLNIAQATLGSKIAMKTLEGKKVTLKIPPGTPSGKRFRVRGQGVSKAAEGAGDLIVEVSITVPEALTEEQERMIREFADAGGMKY